MAPQTSENRDFANIEPDGVQHGGLAAKIAAFPVQ
jgi:hypothetical protein